MSKRIAGPIIRWTIKGGTLLAHTVDNAAAHAKPLPPGPPGRDLLLIRFREFRKDPLSFYSQVHRRYGDSVRLRALNVQWFSLAHPDAVKHVLATHHQNYRKPDLFNKPVTLLAGKGILTSEGAYWQQQRKLSNPAFQADRLKPMVPIVTRAAEELVERWKQMRGTTLDFSQEITRVTLKVVGEILFSTDVSSDADAFGGALRVAFAGVDQRMNNQFAPPLWVPTRMNRDFRKAKATIDQVVESLIAQRRSSPAPKGDLLSLLMAAKDDVTGKGMSDAQVRDEVVTLLIAGHDTLTAALSWTWYLLGKHPDAAQKLYSELRSVLGGRSPGWDDLARLPYNRMVLEESLRLYPPAWGQPRQALVEDEIGDYRIPKGVIVALSQYVTHRHPAFWDDPDTFRPERFEAAEAAKRPKWAYFPFGGGPRVCIGRELALVEGQLIQATVLQHFPVRLVADHPIVPDPTFTLRPKYGVRVTL